MKTIILMLVLFFLAGSAFGASIDSVFSNNELVVSVSGAVDMSGFQFNVKYNQETLRVKSVQKGDFLEKDGNQSFFSEGNPKTGMTENILAVRLGNIPGVNGTGTLAKISFEKIKDGAPNISIENVILTNSKIEKLSANITPTVIRNGGSTPPPSTPTTPTPTPGTPGTPSPDLGSAMLVAVLFAGIVLAIVAFLLLKKPKTA